MEKTFSGSPVGNEASSAALAKAGVWQRDWFWISLLWLFKLGVDVIFWKNQAAEYVLDNIDYLDYAKQYFYAKDAATFYGIFLSSFGRIISPFQSWLIFIGKRTFRHVSFEAIAYLIQAACLLFLTVAALQISKRIVELWGRQWSFPCTLALSAGIIFAPLAVGLSRGTLVELMLAATIVGTSWFCFKISRNGNDSQECDEAQERHSKTAYCDLVKHRKRIVYLPGSHYRFGCRKRWLEVDNVVAKTYLYEQLKQERKKDNRVFAPKNSIDKNRPQRNKYVQRVAEFRESAGRNQQIQSAYLIGVAVP